MIPVQRITAPADTLQGQSVVALYFSDIKPLEGPVALLDWRLDGQLTRMLVDKQVDGRAGEHVMLQNNGKFNAEWVLLIGGGQWHGLCRDTHASLIRHMLAVATQAGFNDVALSFLKHDEVPVDVLQGQIEQAIEVSGKTITSCCFCCEESVSV